MKYKVRICFIVEVEAETEDEAIAIAVEDFRKEILETPEPYDIEDVFDVEVEEVDENEE